MVLGGMVSTWAITFLQQSYITEKQIFFFVANNHFCYSVGGKSDLAME